MQAPPPSVYLTGLLLLVVGFTAGCDGVTSFERDNRLDPTGDRYVPSAPDTVTVQIVDADVVRVSWSSENAGHDAYVLLRRPAQGDAQELKVVAPEDTVAFDTLTTADVYTYSVAVRHGQALSFPEASRPVSVTGWGEKTPLARNVNDDRLTDLALAGGGEYVLLVTPNTAQIYDVASQTWQTTDHPGRISGFGDEVRLSLHTLQNGGVFYTANEPGRFVHAYFDPETQEWARIGGLKFDVVPERFRGYGVSTLDDGSVLFAGLVELDGTSTRDHFAGVWTPGTSSFRPVQDPPNRADRYTLLTQISERRALLQGFIFTSEEAEPICYVFDGQDETWSEVSSCDAAPITSTHAKARLPDNRLFTSRPPLGEVNPHLGSLTRRRFSGRGFPFRRDTGSASLSS